MVILAPDIWLGPHRLQREMKQIAATKWATLSMGLFTCVVPQ